MSKTCEQCGAPAKKRFCSRSCVNKWGHAHGLRRDYVNDVSKKGKTYEDMYGEKRAKELREAKSKLTKGKTYEEIHGVTKAKELRQVRSERFTGEKHPLWGKPPSQETRDKISEGNKGERNGMYGQPPPVSSIRGIQGTFHGVIFRSRYELAFLMQAYDEGWFKEIAPEPFTIPYQVDAEHKTYRPDYLRTDTNELFEIKPEWKIRTNYKHWNTKAQAAQEYCERNGLTYIVLTEVDLPNIPSRKEMKRIEGVIFFRKDLQS